MGRRASSSPRSAAAPPESRSGTSTRPPTTWTSTWSGPTSWATAGRINGFPPVITIQPQGGWVYAGDTLTLQVAVTGTAPLTYQWQRNGTNCLGATNALLTLANIKATHLGSYRVIVRNFVTSVTSAAAVVSGDFVRPTVAITDPQNNGSVSGTPYAVRGWAKDAMGVSNVWVAANG